MKTNISQAIELMDKFQYWNNKRVELLEDESIDFFEFVSKYEEYVDKILDIRFKLHKIGYRINYLQELEKV